MATPNPVPPGDVGSRETTAVLYGVDAFADAPFRGNPAAVCLMKEAASETWMQSVAAEMNLSETAFLFPMGAWWSLRWFTPVVEVNLCGHATLASAHVLWVTGRLRQSEAAVFHTRASGTLTCVRKGSWISMDFPACPPREKALDGGLLEALGLGGDAVWTGVAGDDAFVQVADPDQIRRLRPDFGRLAKFPVRGIVVTAAERSGGFDFVSRFFAPGSGIDEDPVTGSAHCALAPYWGGRLDKAEMRGWQASARGGEVRVHWKGDRVELIGRAVMAWQGEWVAEGIPGPAGAGFLGTRASGSGS